MLCQCNKTTGSRQVLGTHLFSLLPSPVSISLTISKPNSPPLISFPIPIQFDVKFHSKDIWGFSDQTDQPWLLQFTHMQNAYRAIAILGLISAATDPARSVPWELPNQRTEGRPVAPGDTVKLSFTAFSIANFPYLGAIASNHSSLITQLVLRPGVPNFFDLLSGMFCRSTRVVYAANCSEPKLPQGNVVYVVTVVKVRYSDDPETAPLDGGESEYEYESEEEEEEEPRKPAARERPEPTPEPEREVPPEPEREMTPEELEEQRKANLKARMQRIGQAAGGLMMSVMPVVPGARLRKVIDKEQTGAEPVAVEPPRPSPFEIARTAESARTAPSRPEAAESARTATARAASSESARTAPSESARTAPSESARTATARTAAETEGPRKRTLSERIDALEAADRRLAALLQPPGGFNPDAVITGVSTLAAQLRTAQAQTEQLQRSLQEVTVKAGESTTTARQADAIRKELDDAKRAGAVLDRQVKENVRKVRELEGEVQDAADMAREKATQLIKEMMDSVFQGMLRLFPADGRWTGAEISEELATLLRDQSEKTLAVISEKGLL